MSSQRYDEISTRSLEPDSTRPDSLTPDTRKSAPADRSRRGRGACGVGGQRLRTMIFLVRSSMLPPLVVMRQATR